MQPILPLICPLCLGREHRSFYQDQHRIYLRCQSCLLVHVPASYHLSQEAEKAEYDCHQNSPSDQGYRKFLSRLTKPLTERIAPNSSGLDFGCGPGPTLSVMLEELGHQVSLFDLYYCNQPQVLQRSYDFITATEVVEHLAQPSTVLNTLWRCLKQGGYFAIMTKLVIDEERFATWHYKNDPTHITFFSRTTFDYFFADKKASIEHVANDVTIIKKC